MSRRRTNSNSVSLFPFLAVLLCAMGALLFLLIVATRMIRDEAVQKHATEAEPSGGSLRLLTELEETAPPVLTERDIRLGPARRFPEPPRPEIAPLAAPQPMVIVHEPDPLPDFSPRIAKLRAELTSLDASRKELERKARQLDELKTQRAAIEGEIESRERILSNADSAIRELDDALEENERKVAALKSRRQQLEQSHKELTEELQSRENQPRSVSNPLKIVPYEGTGGTTRRPLILECREKVIVFRPEGIALAEQDLRGFTTLDNPLLSGVLALDRFWAERDREQGISQRPYVLIVVRPDGIPAYYALRQMLSEYDQPFGYELLADDQSLALDPPDSKAREVLSASVAQVLARREELATSGAPSAFSLPESRPASALPEKSPGTSRPEPAESRPVAGSRRPQFRQTPRGLEIIPPDDDSGESLVPAPSHGGTSSPARTADQSGPPSFLNPRDETASTALGGAKPPAASAGRPAVTSEATPPSKDGAAASSLPDLREFEPNGSQTDSRTSQAPLLPTNPLLSNSGASATSSLPKVTARQGLPTIADGKIRFQRELTVILGADELRVGFGQPLPLAEGISTRDLLTLAVDQLREETASWGSPPEHLSWKPVVRFVIQPGGYQHYERMRPYFERHNLVDSVSFELNGEPNQNRKRPNS